MKKYFLIISSILLLNCTVQKSILDFSYINSDEKFIETQGDFNNVKYNNSNYNIMVKYFKNDTVFGKNIIKIIIRSSRTTEESILNKDVSVESKKYGKFNNRNEKQFFKDLPQVIFIKKLKTYKYIDLKKDTIVVSIDNQKYYFKI